MARAGSETTPAEEELVFALCHEIGNLLAAARLEAGLLVGAAPDDLAAASRRLSEISAWAGSLLASVRPLLDPNPAPAMATDPGELLDGLRSGLDASCDERVAIESGGELPDVMVAAEVVYHLLLSEVFFGLQAADSVRVSARAEGGHVELSVAHVAGGPPRAPDDALRGRPLGHAVARALLARHGGWLEVAHGGESTRVSFCFHAAAS